MATQSPTEETSATPKKKQVQPRHHAAKNKQAATQRRKTIIKGILEGKTNKQAGLDAGLSPHTVESQISRILKEPQVKNGLLAAMEKIGLTDEYLAKKHKQLAEGKRYLPARGGHPGSAEAPGYIAVDDCQALAKALDIAHKLAGRYVDKMEHNVKSPVNIIIRKFCSRGEKPAEEGKAGICVPV